jgi:hypothetical protein
MARTPITPRLGPISEEYELACLARARIWEEAAAFASALEAMGRDWNPFRAPRPRPPRDMTPAVTRSMGLI